MSAVAVGASWYWMFGLALLGIYLRPKGETYDTVNSTLEQWAKVAFAATGVMAGSMFYDTLSQGDVAAQLLWGVALGTMAFVSQMIVGSILMIGKGYTPQDRWYFACAYQNGLMAMILGVSTGAIALVVPAIVATHVLYGDFAASLCVERRNTVRFVQ